MTEQEVQEFRRLENEYNRLVRINNDLVEQINYAIANIPILVDNMIIVGNNVTPKVDYISQKVSQAEYDVTTLDRAMVALSEEYFAFKELSTASKNLTQFNDEYFTKFKFYNELRRISLGYVIGLDSYIISNETLRKKVEKSYLANTDYWLAYAIMSVMLWASDERQAAQRALQKALNMDAKKSAVFYLLINLRFGRIESASNWYLYYLERSNVNNLGREWQSLLQAYLTGALGVSPELERVATEFYKRLFDQTKAVNASYDLSVQNKAEAFMATYLHVTAENFPYLELYATDYAGLKRTLSEFEKFDAVAMYFDEIYNQEEAKAQNTNEKIENILYDLINAYDEKEEVLIKKIKYNEFVIAARGDLVAANQKYNEEFPDETLKYNAGEMLMKWAFSSDTADTNITVKKFAISQLNNNIIEGFKAYANKLKSSFNESIAVNIKGCDLICKKDNFEECSHKIRDYFLKNKLSTALKDKLFLIFILLCFGSLLLVGGAFLFIDSNVVFSILLSLGIVGGVICGFLLWRRYVDISNELQETYRTSLVKLQDVFEEIYAYYRLIEKNAASEENLYNSVQKFNQ